MHHALEPTGNQSPWNDLTESPWIEILAFLFILVASDGSFVIPSSPFLHPSFPNSPCL